LTNPAFAKSFGEINTVVDFVAFVDLGFAASISIYAIHGANRFQRIVSQLTLSSFLAYRSRYHPFDIIAGSEVGINLLESPLMNFANSEYSIA
jgi:hypothetical protein